MSKAEDDGFWSTHSGNVWIGLPRGPVAFLAETDTGRAIGEM